MPVLVTVVSLPLVVDRLILFAPAVTVHLLPDPPVDVKVICVA